MAPNYLAMLTALEIWQQAGLIEWRDCGERIWIKTVPPQGKVDLSATQLWQYIEKGDVNNVG